MRFAMTAKTLAHQRANGDDMLNEITALNVRKVTRFRKDGETQLEQMVEKLKIDEVSRKKKEAAGEEVEERKDGRWWKNDKEWRKHRE